MEQIPKVIHYFWFGHGEISELTKKCIESWKHFCPDYEIKLWDESNFDIHCIPFVEQAYEAKKYAFVVDYARFYVLYHEGGLYLETDSELLRPIDELLDNDFFIGFGDGEGFMTCLLGMKKNHPAAKAIMSDYENRNFKITEGVYDQTVIGDVIGRTLKKDYSVIFNNRFQEIQNITFYPRKFFYTNFRTGKYDKKHAYVYHHADGSWLTAEERQRNKIIGNIQKILGKKLGFILGRGICSLKYNGLIGSLQKLILKIKRGVEKD